RRAQHNEIAAERYLHDEFAEQALEMVVGGRAFPIAVRDRVGHGAARNANFHRAQILEVAAHRRLCRDDSLGFEQLHELGLARHWLVLEDGQDAMLALRFSERDHQTSCNRSASTARAACMRLAAWGHTSERGPSITSA